MMTDIVSLMDAIDIDKAHIIGVSMGGMIAQLMAIHHPHRVQTLTSIMSMTGDKSLPPIDKNVQKILNTKPLSSEYKDRRIYHINKWRAIGSPKYPASEGYLGEYVDRMLERGITAEGTLRQLLAIMAAENRESSLSALSMPSLVIHGDSDPLINIAGGKATANVIPNAKLKIYQGMGHDFPIELIPSIANDIISHAKTSTSELI
jgi:pimeloyl-ACP methyl ester carboxylesterase